MSKPKEDEETPKPKEASGEDTTQPTTQGSTTPVKDPPGNGNGNPPTP